MRLFQKVKDGGPESPVDAYVLVEIKGLFSIMLLKFNRGYRTSFHTHAFDALTWFLKGNIVEERLFLEDEGNTLEVNSYKRTLLPKITKKDNLHRVKASVDSWCFTLRGPWNDYWKEYDIDTSVETELTHGRTVVSEKVKGE